MESHFDNGDLIKGNIDNSGVRVFYTDTMREHEAGALLVGDSLVARFGEKVKTDFEYENSCPSECTSKFKQDINIFSSFLHMHTTGKDIYTNVFSKNGTYLDTMNKVRHGGQHLITPKLNLMFNFILSTNKHLFCFSCIDHGRSTFGVIASNNRVSLNLNTC